MAIVLVNPDGSSNAKAGDIVVTGGGVYKKNAGGSSTRIGGIDTASGKSGNFNDVVSTFNRLISAGSDKVVPQNTITPAADPDTEVFDSSTNYDDFTLPYNYNYSGSSASSSATLSKVVGYGIVSLVLLVVADRLMGK